MSLDWSLLAANILKSELKRRGITYDQLQQKLSTLGIQETTSGIKMKVSRGTFQFAFFLQVMKAIGAKTLRLEED